MRPLRAGTAPAFGERDLAEPTADEPDQFAAAFAAQQEEMRQETAIWASNMQPLKDLHQRLESFDVGKFPAVESELAKASKSMAAAVEMTNSPVFEAARTAIDSSAVRAQRVFNDPATKAAMDAADSPVVRQQIDAAPEDRPEHRPQAQPIGATLSKPPFDPTTIVFDTRCPRRSVRCVTCTKRWSPSNRRRTRR